jgi:hypothetical protein
MISTRASSEAYASQQILSIFEEMRRAIYGRLIEDFRVEGQWTQVQAP